MGAIISHKLLAFTTKFFTLPSIQLFSMSNQEATQVESVVSQDSNNVTTTVEVSPEAVVEVKPETPVKPTLKPAPIPTTTPWNTRKSAQVPSIDFSSIIRKKPEPKVPETRKEARKAKRKPAQAPRKKPSEKRANSKDDQNEAEGKRTRSRAQGNGSTAQNGHVASRRKPLRNPYYINIQDIEIGAAVAWPSAETKSMAVDACAQQIEYYLGINNLLKDMYLRKHMNAQGWIRVGDIAQFTRVKAITGGDVSVITQAVHNAQGVEYRGDTFDSLCLRTTTKPLNWVLPEDQRIGGGLDDTTAIKTAAESTAESTETNTETSQQSSA